VENVDSFHKLSTTCGKNFGDTYHNKKTLIFQAFFAFFRQKTSLFHTGWRQNVHNFLINRWWLFELSPQPVELCTEKAAKKIHFIDFLCDKMDKI
jgi:hypothetical protein